MLVEGISKEAEQLVQMMTEEASNTAVLQLEDHRCERWEYGDACPECGHDGEMNTVVNILENGVAPDYPHDLAAAICPDCCTVLYRSVSDAVHSGPVDKGNEIATDIEG